MCGCLVFHTPASFSYVKPVWRGMRKGICISIRFASAVAYTEYTQGCSENSTELAEHYVSGKDTYCALS